MNVLELMERKVREMIDSTMTEFSYTGLENLDPKQPCLIVSNHRDIVLDASLLQYALVTNHRRTTQVLAGENLLINPKMAQFCHMNKVFSIARGDGSKRAFYESMLHVSNHIRKAIEEENDSVWVAQRNGRTKNGLDKTEPALIKMFSRSSKLNTVDSLDELHITPMSISYEFESCDFLKARELYISQSGTYCKASGEDMNSILTGIEQFKGHVHITLGRPLTHEELKDAESKGDIFSHVAEVLDQRIWSGYRLWPNNYIAHDMRSEKKEYENKYTKEEWDTFQQHVVKAEEPLKPLLLDIYANPIENQKKIC